MIVFPQPSQFENWKHWASALLVALRSGAEQGEEVAIPKRLAGPQLLTNAAATIYTVPAKFGAVLETIWVSNPTGGVVKLTFSIGTDAAGKRLYDQFPLAAGALERWVGKIPLAEGEIIQAFADTNNVLVITLGGAVQRV